MEQVQPGCFLCAVITQPLVAARISAQNETYLRWGGWGRTALGIAGESPQPCEDLERKARPFRGTPKILKSNIYTVYIIYILYISSMKSKTATIFVSGNECLFLSTSFFLALLHGGSVPIIVGTMNNYVNFLFEIKTQPGVLLRPKR